MRVEKDDAVNDSKDKLAALREKRRARELSTTSKEIIESSTKEKSIERIEDSPKQSSGDHEVPVDVAVAVDEQYEMTSDEADRLMQTPPSYKYMLTVNHFIKNLLD